MSSVRQNILTKIEQCLPYIQTHNGYSNSVKEVFKGLRSLSQSNEFPIAFYFMGGENVENSSEDNSLNFMNCEAYIGVYFHDSNLTDKYESWIRDLKRFILQDRNISIDKTLLFNEVSYISSWNIKSIEPYLDFEKSIGSLIIAIEVQYSEGLETL